MLTRIDTGQVKRAHPVEEIVCRYGIELRPVGRALVGRCPFHADGGRPNLHVYPGNASWYCYRCASGGDVISFVMRLEGRGFRDAVARLERGSLSTCPMSAQPHRQARTRRARPTVRGAAERACLAAAVELYHNRLVADPAALAYVAGRGLERSTLKRCRVGYAGGDELAAYLRWRRLPAQAAVRVGLLGCDGREFLAGRVVVPEIRRGEPLWLVGRTVDGNGGGPKYLGLPGAKPLLGWEMALGSPMVILVEGVFDWLTLVQWGFPALALVGTCVRPEALRAVGARFERVYLALDADDAGREAAFTLAGALGPRAATVRLPDGVKDVAELAPRPDGRAVFADALRPEEQALAAAA
jgi:DNA primase catalytic core